MAFSDTNAITLESGLKTISSFKNCVFRTELITSIIVIIIVNRMPELKYLPACRTWGLKIPYCGTVL
jgi:hypothetical protein